MTLFVIQLAAIGLANASGLPANGTINLDGSTVAVRWDDGDTFKVVDTGASARLGGYNTLENYGAVHRFGPGVTELLRTSERATKVATSQTWTCTTQEGGGGYGRIRVSCPDLAAQIVRQGLAHVFAVGSDADKDLLSLQAQAIEDRVGMWAHGAPVGIVTSVHSVNEKPGQVATYNRVVSTTSGLSEKRVHSEVVPPCRWVCHDGSCLLYVPYSQRYGDDKAACLQ